MYQISEDVDIGGADSERLTAGAAGPVLKLLTWPSTRVSSKAARERAGVDDDCTEAKTATMLAPISYGLPQLEPTIGS